jgi:hypothetical protein
MVSLTKLAKNFACSIPEGEFSIAALQGCKFYEGVFLFIYLHSSFMNLDLIKHKSQPEAATKGASF